MWRALALGVESAFGLEPKAIRHIFSIVYQVIEAAVVI
jgi:hypothetical protein